ncbi:MAG: omptin family outer membrane protease [Treponema sp.]|jgi:outer membrane protease|nr:omptin family outer membrane protease [Treponema sp.]
MYKTYGAFCCLFVFLHQIAAAQNNLSFAFTPEAGVLSGLTWEYVYEGDKCISRLDWKDGAIPVLSFSGQAALSGTFLRLNALSAVLARNGTMKDFDFLTGGGGTSLYSNMRRIWTNTLTFRLRWAMTCMC